MKCGCGRELPVHKYLDCGPELPRERRTKSEIAEEIRRTQAEVAQMDPSGTVAKLLDAAAQAQRIDALEAALRRIEELASPSGYDYGNGEIAKIAREARGR